MPTYEYRCTQCGYQYERREGFDAPAAHVCSRCGGESRRVLHAPPVLFKGSGFYVTDNRKTGLVGSSTDSSGSNGGDGEKAAGVESVEAATPVAESKPADKTSKKPSETAAAG
ncbi:MAG: FmdB family zinc ribbon protein [Dehalococcoidia bacterium]